MLYTHKIIRYIGLCLVMALSSFQSGNALEKMGITSIRISQDNAFISFFGGSNDPNNLDGLRIYEAEGITTDPNKFTEIRDIDLTDYPDVDNLMWQGSSGELVTNKGNNFPDREMTYTITAYKGQNESEFHDSLYYFNRKEPVTVSFKSNPPDLINMLLDEEAGYDANAEVSNGGDVKYKIANSTHPNIEIDESTGLVEWEAEKLGTHQFDVVAYYVDDESIYKSQKVNFNVYECEKDISGFIKLFYESYSTGATGKLEFYKHGDDTNKVIKSFNVYDGDYEGKIYNGKYKVKFVSSFNNNRVEKWYDNVNYPSNAEVIEVSCQDTVITFNWDVVDTKAYFVNMTNPLDRLYHFLKIGENLDHKINYTTLPKDAEVVFTLLDGPQGMTLEGQNNDIISYEAQDVGFYQYKIKAHLKDYPEISDQISGYIWVSECSERPTLTMNIYDKNSGKKLDRTAIANVYKIVGFKQNGDYAKVVKFDSVLLENGQLQQELGEGKFLVDLTFSERKDDGWKRYHTYVYDESEERDTIFHRLPDYYIGDAEIIEISCDDITRDWELNAPESVEYYNVSGIVLDEDTQEPIQSAIVTLRSLVKSTGEVKTRNKYSGPAGEFHFIVPDNEIYTISAASGDTMSQIEYLREYWEETSDPLNATNFELEGDKDNLVFTLEKRPDYDNSLSGVLKDENGAVIPDENVVAYLVETGSFGHHYLYKGTSTTTNGNGEFEIKNLIPGSYVVYAYSRHNRELVPGYYKSDSDLLTSRWQEGKLIEVEANGNFGIITMQMELLGPIVRNKTLSGKVGTMTSLAPGSEEPENGLRGVNVFVTDETGNVINHTHSENEGDFKVENLKTGELTVIYDKVGYKAEQQTVTFDKEDTEKYTTAEMTKLSPTKVNEYTEIEAVVYPNPSSQSVNIRGDFTGSEYMVKLVDMNGRVQLYKKVNYNDSEVLELNVSELTSGNYLLLITGNGEKVSTPLKVIR